VIHRRDASLRCCVTQPPNEAVAVLTTRKALHAAAAAVRHNQFRVIGWIEMRVGFGANLTRMLLIEEIHHHSDPPQPSILSYAIKQRVFPFFTSP
jgi:hypothetical protein